ncbi:hypothetical protein U1Q18_032544 [Sarracenia purpurea var. burkii]
MKFDELFDDEYGQDEKTMTDLHLGSAINLDHIEYLVKGKFEDYRIYITQFQKMHWNSMRKDAVIFPKQEIGFLSSTQELLLEDSPMAILDYKLYKSLTSVGGRSLRVRGIDFPLAKSYEKICNSTILCNSIYMEFFWFTLKMACMVSEASRGGTKSFYNGIWIRNGAVYGVTTYKDIHWQVISINSVCILSDMKNQRTSYGSFDSLLLIMDTLGQRLCLEIGMRISYLGEGSGAVSYDVSTEIIKTGDAILCRYGNMGYEFIGMFEALVVAALLKRNPDPITDSDEFFVSYRNELEEMIVGGTFDQQVLTAFDLLSQLLVGLRDDWLLNIFCIYRIWGHPRVDIKRGMKKVMEKGIAKKYIPSDISRVILLQFKKMFLTEFYDRHHQYPPCTFYDEEQTYLRESITANLPISVDHSRYTIFDFETIEVDQLWDLPETYDVCHVLNDKSVSPTRSELHESISRNLGTVMGAQRRGIVRWLLSDSIRCRDFLQDIDINRLGEDSLIIGMYEKGEGNKGKSPNVFINVGENEDVFCSNRGNDC